MYRGTHDGDIDEIKFVALFNSDKERFDKYLSRFTQYNNVWMVRVTTKQYSTLSDRKVFTRSDCYLASIASNIDAVLEENDYLLSEEILKAKNIDYIKIPGSGISIKMTNSKSYQILKTGPNSFNMLFGSYELGAGASLFCMREEELPKNADLLIGWKTTAESMADFFNQYTSGNTEFYLNKEICEKIKNYSCNRIKELIDNSTELQEKVFNGKHLYEEPYTAFYFYHGNEIMDLTTIPFSVTTGSGRSRGDYTIVLKPINR